MPRPLPPPTLRRDTGPGKPNPPPKRCPRCGEGELLTLAVGRRGAATGRAAFCAGLYDRERRRIVLRSCGYSDGAKSGAAGGPAISA